MDARSPPTIKTITLIRHGAALHNVYDAQTRVRPNHLDPRFTDPPLVAQGEMQARTLGEQLRRRGMIIGHRRGGSTVVDNNPYASSVVGLGGKEGEDSYDASMMHGDGKDDDAGVRENGTIELVVCSPLMRCLQTASLIFPSYFSQSSEGLLALEDDYNQLHTLDRSCSLFCHGDLREAFGVHYTDKRGPLSRLKSKFPAVRYHPLLTENDEDWRHDYRETRGDVSRRIHHFFLWLMRQPHSNVAIVTHGVWMECALMNYWPEALDFGKKRVYNCDVYSGKLMLSLEQDGPVLRDVEKIEFHVA